jgi:hypothetical protein
MRIPRQICHPFHAKPATNSTAKLPPIPRQSCHLYLTKSATLQQELATLDNPGNFSFPLIKEEKKNASKEVIHAQDKGSTQVKIFRS